MHLQIRRGLMDLSQRILGPNTITQGALATIFRDTPQTYYDSIVKIVKVFKAKRNVSPTSVNDVHKLVMYEWLQY